MKKNTCEKVINMVDILRKEAIDPRDNMIANLERFEDIPNWTLGGTSARIAPFFLAKTFKDGSTAATAGRRFIQEKELDGCHTANEYLLLSMVLDRLVRSGEIVMNSEALEIICRLHGIRRAFADVRRVGDWKQPRGQNGQKWKSKVRWGLCDQYDIRALDREELSIPEADEEVKRRLESVALFNKYFEKASIGGQKESEE